MQALAVSICSYRCELHCKAHFSSPSLSHPNLQSRQGILVDGLWKRCSAGRGLQVVSSDSASWCLLATTLISAVDPGGSWELDTIPEALKSYRCLPLGHRGFMGSLSETRYLAAPRAWSVFLARYEWEDTWHWELPATFLESRGEPNLE